MLRRSILALLGGAAATPALSAAAPTPAPATQQWFVQVWFEAPFPVEADPSSSPGRIEISIAGAFVACAWAAVYQSRRNEIFLVPLSIGAAATGRKEDIKVEIYGELKRLTRPVIKITEIAA